MDLCVTAATQIYLFFPLSPSLPAFTIPPSHTQQKRNATYSLSTVPPYTPQLLCLHVSVSFGVKLCQSTKFGIFWGGWMLNLWGPSHSNPPKTHAIKPRALWGAAYSRDQLMLVQCLFTWSSCSCRLLFLKGLCGSSWALAADGQRAGRDGPWCSINGVLPASCDCTASLWVLYSLEPLSTEVRCITRLHL